MIYIYCGRKSTGARDLARALGGKRLIGQGVPRDASLVVCWGTPIGPTKVKTLNNIPGMRKRTELRTLQMAKVPVPEFHLTRPEGVRGEWLGRDDSHQGGSDLLKGTGRDYFVEKLPLEKEFRVHVFKGKSIRLGMKVHRVGVQRGRPIQHHPWIRSYDAGWMLSYGEDAQQGVAKGVREVAKKSVEALGLDFGAVDVGVTAKGKIYVLEVNRAPGNEGNTTLAYAKAIAGVA